MDNRRIGDLDVFPLGLGCMQWTSYNRIKRLLENYLEAADGADTITLAPGLHLAGDWTWAPWPATLEGAVRSGRRAAAARASAL